VRFVIGRRYIFYLSLSFNFFTVKISLLTFMTDFCSYNSANKGDNFDRAIDEENRKTNDFLILVSYLFFSFLFCIFGSVKYNKRVN
jgi:hypothetical protein